MLVTGHPQQHVGRRAVGRQRGVCELGNERGAGRKELGQRDRPRTRVRRIPSQRLARSEVGRDVRERYVELKSRDPHAVIVPSRQARRRSSARHVGLHRRPPHLLLGLGATLFYIVVLDKVGPMKEKITWTAGLWAQRWSVSIARSIRGSKRSPQGEQRLMARSSR